jgi:hypothetical protein
MGRSDSNRRPPASKAGASPLGHSPISQTTVHGDGFEPPPVRIRFTARCFQPLSQPCVFAISIEDRVSAIEMGVLHVARLTRTQERTQFPSECQRRSRHRHPEGSRLLRPNFQRAFEEAAWLHSRRRLCRRHLKLHEHTIAAPLPQPSPASAGEGQLHGLATSCPSNNQILVGFEGLEPSRLSAPASETGAYANSARSPRLQLAKSGQQKTRGACATTRVLLTEILL